MGKIKIVCPGCGYSKFGIDTDAPKEGKRKLLCLSCGKVLSEKDIKDKDNLKQEGNFDEALEMRHNDISK